MSKDIYFRIYFNVFIFRCFICKLNDFLNINSVCIFLYFMIWEDDRKIILDYYNLLLFIFNFID